MSALGRKQKFSTDQANPSTGSAFGHKRPLPIYLGSPSSNCCTPVGIISQVALEPTNMCMPISIFGSPFKHPNVTPCTAPWYIPHIVEPHRRQNWRPNPFAVSYVVNRSSPDSHLKAPGATSAYADAWALKAFRQREQ